MENELSVKECDAISWSLEAQNGEDEELSLEERNRPK